MYTLITHFWNTTFSKDKAMSQSVQIRIHLRFNNFFCTHGRIKHLKMGNTCFRYDFHNIYVLYVFSVFIIQIA